MTKLHCRFCGELKGAEKLLDLELHPEKLQETEEKLKALHLALPNLVFDGTIISKTVCFVCVDDLNKANQFLVRFNKAQLDLIKLFNKNEDPKPEVSDAIVNEFYDEPIASDGFDEDDQPLSTLEHKFKLETNEKPEESLVKTEPKDSDNEDVFNVQSLLNAGIFEVPLYQSTPAYLAKEFEKLPKNAIKSWADYPWLCQFCGISFPSVDVLREHSKAQHKRCTAYTCVDCYGVALNDFKGFKDFLGHVTRHRRSLLRMCPYCNKSFKNNADHMKEHFAEINCKACGETFSSESDLKQHTTKFTSTKPKQIKRKPGQKITEEELTCDVCHKVYKNLNSLRDHKKSFHLGERRKEYTCELCGKAYFTKGTLTSHISTNHEKIKPHTCKICQKSFPFPHMLRRHVGTHSNVKPFSCELCGRCFRVKKQLDSHQIVHTDIMPYTCKYCGKKFKFSSIMQTHERQHTGARPYNCQDCSLEFTNWSNYNKHMKRRHGMTTAKKKITPNGVFPIDPVTGKVVILDQDCEEWKKSIMVPAKWCRKKAETS